MEAFTLLKYWKGATAACHPAAGFPVSSSGNAKTTTILAAGEFDSDGDDDEGPFINLEFAVPAENDNNNSQSASRCGKVWGDTDVTALPLQRRVPVNNAEIVDDEEEEDDDDDDDDDDDYEHSVDANVSESPRSDDLLFKGRIVRINGGSEDDVEDEVTAKSGQFQIPVSLLRSATKFRFFMLGLKRSKSDSQSHQPKHNQQPNNKKLFTVKFTVNSGEDSGEEKRNNKKDIIMQKYLKLVNLRNIRAASKQQRHREGAFSVAPAEGKGECTVEEVTVAAAGKKEMKGLNLKGMMMANSKKHLGKSKSAVVYSTMQQNAALSNNRRDDSLLQQQDGIQGAILHCKRSFLNSSSAPLDLEEREESETGQVLTRSASDPTHEKKRATTAATTAATTESTREDKKVNDLVYE